MTPEAQKSAGDDHGDMTTEKVLSQYGGISEMASSIDAILVHLLLMCLVMHMPVSVCMLLLSCLFL